MWAFGTSPHGLGLSAPVFWALTAPEFHALKDVHDAPVRRWATTEATLRNAHFPIEGVPWTADDFLGTGNRADRVKTQQKDDNDVAFEKMRLMRIVPGVEPDDLPEWAKGPYMGNGPAEPAPNHKAAYIMETARRLFPGRYDLKEPVNG